MISYQTIWNSKALGVVHMTGLKATWLTENNLLTLFHIHLLYHQSLVVYHKTHFWALLLFLIYINDLAFVSSNASSMFLLITLNHFISGNDPDKLVTSVNKEMTKIIEWQRTNRLSLNIKKTHFMMFRKWKQKITSNTELLIDDKKVEQVEKNSRRICWLIANLAWSHSVYRG